MSLSILGVSGAQRGNELDETGCNLDSFECRYFPEVNEKLPDIKNETRGRARSAKFSREVSLEAEVLGNTGVMAFGLATACTVANDVSTFGDGTGTLFLEEATEKQARGAWRSVSMKLESNPGLVLS